MPRAQNLAIGTARAGGPEPTDQAYQKFVPLHQGGNVLVTTALAPNSNYPRV